MKYLIVILSLALTPFMYAQNWTPEQLEILDKVKSGWTLWSEAVEKGDLDHWMDNFQPTEDFNGWWTSEGAVVDNTDFDVFAKTYLRTVKATQWEAIIPQSIRIFDNTAIIYFYSIYHSQDMDGKWSRHEQKRMEVYRKLKGKWRWTACMSTDSGQINELN